MRTFNGLKRGLGYFTARPQAPLVPSPQTHPDVWTDEVLALWHRRAVRAQAGRAQAWALYNAAERANLGRAALEAIKRFDLDEKLRGKQIAMVITPLGLTPPPRALAPIEVHGSDLEQVGQLTLDVLCADRSTRGAVTYALRDQTDDPAARILVERLSADAVAHADLGFLLWPLIEHQLLKQMSAEDLTDWATTVLEEAFARLDQGLGLDAERQAIDLTILPAPPSPNPGVLPALAGAAALYKHIPGPLARRFERMGIPATQAWKHRHQRESDQAG